MHKLEIILNQAVESFSDKELLALYLDALKLKELSLPKPLALVFADNTIGLTDLSVKEKPIIVDFLAGKLAHRRQYGGGKHAEAVARACFKDATKAIIFDATAGLGRDAFVLAYLGAKVHMFERNEVVRIILRDGLRRAYQSEQGDFFKEHMILQEVRSIWDYQGEVKPDCIYLDPMYPERKKSALVKKDMRTFHDLVGQDLDIDKLLNFALRSSCPRVVLKRPQYADVANPEYLVGQVVAKSQRFDIYRPVKKLH